jgi:hypothetical protein
MRRLLQHTTTSPRGHSSSVLAYPEDYQHGLNPHEKLLTRQKSHHDGSKVQSTWLSAARWLSLLVALVYVHFQGMALSVVFSMENFERCSGSPTYSLHVGFDFPYEALVRDCM